LFWRGEVSSPDWFCACVDVEVGVIEAIRRPSVDVNVATQAAVAHVGDGAAAQNRALAGHPVVVPVVEPAENVAGQINPAA
jgi:hypothetical protein